MQKYKLNSLDFVINRFLPRDAMQAWP